MNATLRDIISAGEGRTTEFKKAQNGLPQSVHETICAFLNSAGGHIFLGVSDDGDILGVAADRIEQIRTDLVNLLNNPQKHRPTVVLDLFELEIDGKTVLYIPVHISSQVQHCSNKIYERQGDADQDVTDNAERVELLYQRKMQHFTENQIYAHATMADLDPLAFDRFRDRLRTRRRDHPWIGLRDEELLRESSLWFRDLRTGEEGLTLAALLMFGTQRTILSVLPQYRTDAICRVRNVDRYDDRDLIQSNLIETYDRLFAFGQKHLADAFHLDGDVRISLRDIILREVIGNMLVHREYRRPAASFVIEPDRFKAVNSSATTTGGTLDPSRMPRSGLRNPTIMGLFREMGLADELGSGIRNLNKYGPIYGTGKPVLLDGEEFMFELPLKPSKELTNEMTENVTEKMKENVTEKMKEKTPDFILRMVQNNKEITIQELAEHKGVSESTIERAIKRLKEEDKLRRVGPDKGGHWEVTRPHSKK